VDVRIGVSDTPKEIEVELAADADTGAVKKDIEQALAGKKDVLWLTDRKGRNVAVPSAKIAYVEVGAETQERRIGYVS